MSGEQPGFFISFEGGDGAGKSTQIKLLAERLQKTGHEVIVTREPGGSPGGEMIRALLVSGDKDRWSPMTEALLMIAARRDHLEKTILPALARGAVVITDRFADSTMAYQGLAGDLGYETVAQLHQIAIGGQEPELTVILDVPIEEGLKRAGDRSGNETRFESKGAEYQARVRDAFTEIARNNPNRCVIIPASDAIEIVADAIWRALSVRMPGLFNTG